MARRAARIMRHTARGARHGAQHGTQGCKYNPKCVDISPNIFFGVCQCLLISFNILPYLSTSVYVFLMSVIIFSCLPESPTSFCLSISFSSIDIFHLSIFVNIFECAAARSMARSAAGFLVISRFDWCSGSAECWFSLYFLTWLLFRICGVLVFCTCLDLVGVPDLWGARFQPIS